MKAFKALLVLIFVEIVVCTGLVVAGHGWDLVTVYFEQITSLTWSGQFVLDFTWYLTLSGLWIAWRHDFSGKGIALGVSAALLGMLFFAPYLLWAIHDASSDAATLLLGNTRATQLLRSSPS